MAIISKQNVGHSEPLILSIQWILLPSDRTRHLVPGLNVEHCCCFSLFCENAIRCRFVGVNFAACDPDCHSAVIFAIVVLTE